MEIDSSQTLSNDLIWHKEGPKTTGFEICDQLQWELPDRIVTLWVM
jgi:hypothetical protein